MRLLVEPSYKDSNIFNTCKSVILSLKDYSVQGFCYFTIDEIIDIKNKYKDIEIFVSLNKNFLNHEVEGLKDVLIKLSELNECEINDTVVKVGAGHSIISLAMKVSKLGLTGMELQLEYQELLVEQFI